MPRPIRILLLLLAPALSIAAAELSPACRQATSALKADFLNLKEQSSTTLHLSADDSSAKIPITLDPSAPVPLVALGQYAETSNSGLTGIIRRTARSSNALNTLLNPKNGDAAAQTAYTDCSKELGIPGFFDLVARDYDAPDWAAIPPSVHRLLSEHRGSITGFLYHWDKHEPVQAMFFLLSAFQHDPSSINAFRVAYNADGKKLAQLVRAEIDGTCKWADIVSVSQAQQEQNREKFQGFLRRLDQGNPQDAYHFLFTQLLGSDQPSKDNFASCRQVDSPRVDCITHKAFNREKDFDKCSVH